MSDLPSLLVASFLCLGIFGAVALLRAGRRGGLARGDLAETRVADVKGMNALDPKDVTVYLVWVLGENRHFLDSGSLRASL